MTVTVTLRRGNGDLGRTDETFTVSVDEYTTVLDLLESRRTNQSPDLMYRHSCHHGSCGTCTVRLNGKDVLACITRPASLGLSQLIIEPVRHMPTIGDLAVDPSPVFADIPEDFSYRRPAPALGDDMPGDQREFERLENCIECGACLSACPVADLFMGPTALAAVNRERMKSGDLPQSIWPKLEGPRGVSACERHLECSRVCPMGVYPAKHIMDLRRAIKKRNDA